MNINIKDLFDIEVDGIDMKDAFDFCNSYISSGLRKLKNGKYRQLSEKELNWINDNERDFVYDRVIKHLY